MTANALLLLAMAGIFIFIVIIMIVANWYTKKYKTRITGSQIIISVFVLISVGFYFFIKNMGSDEKGAIIQNIALRTTVTAITFDTHKPYFKNMQLADGQYLPMPESMNDKLQVGDSIYKAKGDKFYTVLNARTKSLAKYEVKVHERIMSKPQ